MKKHLLSKVLMITIGLFFAMLFLIQVGNAEATEGNSLCMCSFPVTVKINGDFDDGKTIGFNIKLNDDDGKNMDHTLGWSKIERQGNNSAYKDPSVFSELRFTPKKEEKTGMKEDIKLVIDNVDRYRVWEARFECVRVIMSYRGEKYSPEYIQGISGAAFRMDGICPCAPTVGNMMNTQDLPKLLGYETDYVYLDQEGIDKKTPVNDIITQVKGEISAGRPVLVWNAFTTAEWDVVCGFDDEKRQFIGRGSYEGLDGYAIADENRFSEWIPDPGPIVIFIKDKVDEFNAKEAEIASLKEAVKHAHIIKEIPADGKWVFLEGLQCYDRWVDDFQEPSKKRQLGDSYCLSVYRTTHRAACGFMKELIPKYPEAKQSLEKASEYFVAEANALNQCDTLIGYNTPEGPDADRNAKTAKLLKQARDNYANAINEIEEALKEIEGESSPASQR